MPQFVVIGLGEFGLSVTRTLAEKGCEVLAIDSDPERVREAGEFVTHAVEMDATDERSLVSLGVKDMDAAIVSIGQNIEDSILVTLTMKELGVKTIIAKAISPQHANVLRKIGVTRIVFPERDMGIKVAHSLIAPNILEYIELSPLYELVETITPKEFVGKTLAQTQARTKYGVQIIAIKKKIPTITDSGEPTFQESIDVAPPPDAEISEGDILVIIGGTAAINKILKKAKP